MWTNIAVSNLYKSVSANAEKLYKYKNTRRLCFISGTVVKNKENEPEMFYVLKSSFFNVSDSHVRNLDYMLELIDIFKIILYA
jgi:hypothetical protein